MSNVEYKPAEKLEINLIRQNSNSPWGFRLQGGIDFKTPLSIQSVQPNSVSEQCGLKPGDAILAINGATSDAMFHDDAKAEIVRSGDMITMLVERGAVKIWKPAVTPLNELRPHELKQIVTATGEEINPIQKTSLAINKPPDEPCRIGSSHNRSAQPFGQPKAAVPNVVHSQYNSPMGLYSAGNIANSYSQQTQGIQKQMSGMELNENGQSSERTSEQVDEQSTPDTTPITHNVGGSGAANSPLESGPTQTSHLDISSSSPDHPLPDRTSPYSSRRPSASMSASQSAVFEEQKGDTPEYKGYTNPNLQSRTFNRLQAELAAEENNNISGGGPGFRSVAAPIAKPPSEKPKQPSMRCGGCDMLATGVIVKANGVPYHVACFKCTSCSMNLKQKGFFVVDNKLYCEIHAKRHAQPPGPDMVATAVYR